MKRFLRIGALNEAIRMVSQRLGLRQAEKFYRVTEANSKLEELMAKIPAPEQAEVLRVAEGQRKAPIKPVNATAAAPSLTAHTSVGTQAVSTAEIRALTAAVADLKLSVAPQPKTHLEALADRAQAMFSETDLGVFSAHCATETILNRELSAAVESGSLPAWVKTEARRAAVRSEIQADINKATKGRK
jgi:hypothetical protein